MLPKFSNPTRACFALDTWSFLTCRVTDITGGNFRPTQDVDAYSFRCTTDAAEVRFRIVMLPLRGIDRRRGTSGFRLISRGEWRPDDAVLEMVLLDVMAVELLLTRAILELMVPFNYS